MTVLNSYLVTSIWKWGGNPRIYQKVLLITLTTCDKSRLTTLNRSECLPVWRGGGVTPCTQVVLLYFISETVHLLYWSRSFIIYTLTGNASFTIWRFVVHYLLGYAYICLTCLLRLIRWLEQWCRVSFVVNYILIWCPYIPFVVGNNWTGHLRQRMTKVKIIINKF